MINSFKSVDMGRIIIMVIETICLGVMGGYIKFLLKIWISSVEVVRMFNRGIMQFNMFRVKRILMQIRRIRGRIIMK